MSGFEAEKGFIHLVFAQEDEYYLKSLACLNMNQFLYYQLKKEYDGIYFISSLQDDYLLEIPDIKSYRYYKETEEKSFFGRFFSDNLDEMIHEEKQEIPKQQDISFRNRIYQILKKRKRQAFVFTIESFSELFYGEYAADEVSELQQKCLGKNIFLIQAPPTMVGSLPYLTDENGFFRLKLFPELFCRQSSSQEKIYERIQEIMGGCCCFLNKLGRQEIRWMVRRCLMDEKNFGYGKIYLEDEYADFLYRWYHSQALRRQTGSILPENERRLMKEIRNVLNRPGTFEKIENWMFQIEEDKKTFSPDPEENYIYMDSPLVRKFSAISIPVDLIGNRRSIEKMDKIRKELKIPHTEQQALEQDENLSFCMRKLQQAGAADDAETFDKVLDALEFCLFHQWIGKGYVAEIWKLRKSTILLSEQVWKITDQIEKDDETIQEFQDNKKVIQEEIRQMEQEGGRLRIPRGEGELISGELLQMHAKKDAVLRLRDEIDNLKKQRAINVQNKYGCIDQIRKQEQMADQIVLGNFSIMDQMVDVEQFRQVQLSNFEQAQKVSETADQMRMALKETNVKLDSQLNTLEIEREYQKMLKEEQDEWEIKQC